MTKLSNTMLGLYIKKLLCIESPTARRFGFRYEYDYRKACKINARCLELWPRYEFIESAELEDLKRVNSPFYVTRTKRIELKPIQLEASVTVEREYYATFKSSTSFGDYIKEAILRQLTPELLKRIVVVTDYNPLFNQYRATGRFKFYDEDMRK